MDKKITLSLREAVKHTGLSRNVLLKYVHGGKLKYIDSSINSKLPRYRFAVKELEKLVEDLQHRPNKV
ncbi:MAG TPA: hypothetical protein DCS13_07565 [Candidatus Margulisbacteria bacterium]|nr:hypothetical protein [Candidatus Margulisiibacteriota bacterium]